MVGAVMADDAKPLPADLTAFLEQNLAEGHGGMYVSMGTAARLTQQEMQGLSEALSALPNPVLWKVSAVQLPSMLIPVLSTCFACCLCPCCCLWLEYAASHAAAVMEVSAVLMYLATSSHLLGLNRLLTFSLSNAGWPVYRWTAQHQSISCTMVVFFPVATAVFWHALGHTGRAMPAWQTAGDAAMYAERQYLSSASGTDEDVL